MNNIDKQHAWDALVAYARAHCGGLLPREEVLGERRAIEQLLAQGCTALEQLVRLQQISATPEPPLFTDAQLATLKILVSTAVWIRGEQLAHPNAFISARVEGHKALPINAEVDTHNLAVTKLRSELHEGIALFSHLSTYCHEHAIEPPEWAK